MTTEYSTLDVLRGASVVAVVLLTAILIAILPAPGYRTSRLVLFLITIGLGWVGAVGAVLNRFRFLLIGAVGQFLLGFWNFTIGLFMLPTGIILLLTALLLRERSDT
ncbi:hypothetical protein ACERIT_06680 [Halopenitus sp. H-Gu1]|uniref:hypothetical protein n=1 Tax=Halopenitus sp. H-Gu1 TaxID=3242697 RepID=UPI00359E8A22